MNMRKVNKLLGLIITILLIGQLGFADQLINGAGATFPYPIYSKWFSEYNKLFPAVKINYQSIGSGAGIRQFTAKTVDFGASDAPMKDEELVAAGAEVIHIPTVLGAVVLSYNLPDIKGDLNLNPSLIAEIYLGKIQKWNDPKIVEVNKTLSLPDLAISPIYRSDGSGTTSVYTDYLAKVSPEWKTSVGAGKAVKWPAGLGGKGNEGVSALVKQTPGSIGYIEQVFALQNKLPMAILQNADGKFVKASVESVTSAANGALKNMPNDFRVSITNAAGPKSYPIAAFTYILIYKDQKNVAGKNLVAFLKWAMGPGQKIAKDLSYAPLPLPLIKKVEAKIHEIKVQ